MSTNDSKALLGRYSIIIEWSDEDDAYVVTLPEFPHCHTHGTTREEALRNAQEVLELLVEADEEWDSQLPPPRLFKMQEQNDDAEVALPQPDEYQKVG